MTEGKKSAGPGRSAPPGLTQAFFAENAYASAIGGHARNRAPFANAGGHGRPSRESAARRHRTAGRDFTGPWGRSRALPPAPSGRPAPAGGREPYQNCGCSRPGRSGRAHPTRRLGSMRAAPRPPRRPRAGQQSGIATATGIVFNRTPASNAQSTTQAKKDDFGPQGD